MKFWRETAGRGTARRVVKGKGLVVRSCPCGGCHSLVESQPAYNHVKRISRASENLWFVYGLMIAAGTEVHCSPTAVAINLAHLTVAAGHLDRPERHLSKRIYHDTIRSISCGCRYCINSREYSSVDNLVAWQYYYYDADRLLPLSQTATAA